MIKTPWWSGDKLFYTIPPGTFCLSLCALKHCVVVTPWPLAQPGGGHPLWLCVQLLYQPAQLVEGSVRLHVQYGRVKQVTEVLLHLTGLLDHLLQLLRLDTHNDTPETDIGEDKWGWEMMWHRRNYDYMVLEIRTWNRATQCRVCGRNMALHDIIVSSPNGSRQW